MSPVWSWRHAILKSKLPATTKHVLMVVSVHMNDMGEGCYPSTKRIAELASLSERSVCEHIANAISLGWIESKVHGFSGQGWARNEYKPAWPKGTDFDAEGTDPHSEGTDSDAKKALTDGQSNIPSKSSKHPPTPKGECVRFEEFWELWGPHFRRTDRKQCEAKWMRYQLDPIADQVLSAVKAWKQSPDWLKDNGQFIPAPLVWLNGRRWENPPVVAPKKPSDPFAPGYNPLGNVSW